MEMNEIYASLQKKLQEIEPAYKALEDKYLFHLAEAEKVEAEMNKTKSNVEALKNAIAALETGNFKPVEEKKEEKQDVKLIGVLTGNPVKVKMVNPRKLRNAKGDVIQYNANGDILNRWPSQRSAAQGLRWDQSGISKFMKQDHNTQIRKKGFYLDWI